MSLYSINDPKHWLDRAKEARALAEQMDDPETKRTMLKNADDYRAARPKSARTTSGTLATVKVVLRSGRLRANWLQWATPTSRSRDTRRLRQVDGGRPAPSAIVQVTKIALSGTPHTRKPFEPRMGLKTGKLYETSDPVRFRC